MYCKSCDKEWSDRITKYRLVIVILDDEQDGQLLLWDNVGSSLLGITASELKGKYSEECKITKQYAILSKKEKKAVWLGSFEFNEYFGQVCTILTSF
nr:replication protein A 70 kDa DNA-binding subunit B-like [Ipomoea batatas]